MARCNKPTPNGPCILEKNHATPREVYAPCTIESYGDGSAIESFWCFGLPVSTVQEELYGAEEEVTA